MDEKSSDKPSKGYGRHSKKYWLVAYLIIAVVVYGLVYLLFVHKSGSSGGGFGY